MNRSGGDRGDPRALLALVACLAAWALYRLASHIDPGRLSLPRASTLPIALGVSALFACGGWEAAAVWYFSLPTSFMMFFRLRLWLEHQGTGDTQRLELTPLQGALLALDPVTGDIRAMIGGRSEIDLSHESALCRESAE